MDSNSKEDDRQRTENDSFIWTDYTVDNSKQSIATTYQIHSPSSKAYGIQQEAREEWELTHSENVRNAILKNVFCPNCKFGSFSSNYKVFKDGGNFIIVGYCAKCGSPVSRSVEKG